MFVIGSAPSVLKEKPEKMAKSWTKTQVVVYMPYGERHHTTQNHGKIEENGAKMDNHRFFREGSPELRCSVPAPETGVPCPGNCIWRRGQGDAQKDQEHQYCKDQETDVQNQSPRWDEYQPHLASSEIRGDNS